VEFLLNDISLHMVFAPKADNEVLRVPDPKSILGFLGFGYVEGL
jgi:hypothetical protein